MNLLELLMSMSCMSLCGLILGQIIFWQQAIWHELHEQIQQVYQLILSIQQFQVIERELTALCSVLPLEKMQDGLGAFGETFLHQSKDRIDFSVLIGEPQWFESPELPLKTCQPHMKIWMTNFKQSQNLIIDSCQGFSRQIKVNLNPPFMVLKLMQYHMDFRDHKIRIYQQGKPQIFTSGFTFLELKILNNHQLSWELGIKKWPHLKWVSQICTK
jgi:hypothetical protein